MKKLKIDFDELQKAMEDTERDAFDYFLDRETGEIIILSEDILGRARRILSQELDEDMGDYDEVEFDEPPEIPGWMEDEIELALDIFLYEKGRYERIPERETEAGYKAMKGFAEKLDDPHLKQSLLEILDGPGAFRRFKDALDSHPKAKKLWYGFNAKVAKDEMKEWLRTLSIEGIGWDKTVR
jgi:SNF2 family DNA or RNA helicase